MSKFSSKVHRVRFYNPKPQPISCAAINKTLKQLALARGDASIEIWDVNYSPYLVKFIPAIENGSVEALCWVDDRLLTTGLSGALVEWDLDRLVIKNTVMLTGNAAWCLDVTPDNKLAAAGTEQGYINLYNVDYGDILYEKLFDKQEGRILCCKFDITGKLLATGSINTIRVWNVAKGHAITRISVEQRGKQVIVWCLAFLGDGSLVSGDSAGRLSFWDSGTGDQKDLFTTHKADITSLAVTDDGQNLFCAGVDPVIMHFTRVANSTKLYQKSHQQWVKNVQRHIHEHDVRVLLTLGERELISAGVDGYLTFSNYPPKWIMRMPPMLPAKRSSICSDKRLLLLRYQNYLEIWKLGACEDPSSDQLVPNPVTNEEHMIDKKNMQTYRQNGDQNRLEQDTTDFMYNSESTNSMNIRLNVKDNPVKLISVQTKKKKQILCCELSPTGEYIFYATSTDVRLLKMEFTENETEQENGETDEPSIFLSKLTVNGVKSPCDRAAFSEDSKMLVVHSVGVIHVLQVDPDVGATVIQTIPTDTYLKSKSLLHLVLSPPSRTGTYLIAADTKSGVSIWQLSGKKFEHHATLPTYQCVPSALNVHGSTGILYIVYVDQTIVEYTIGSKNFAEWPASVLPESWKRRTTAIEAVRAHPARDAVVLQDQNSLWVVEKKLKRETKPTKKGKLMPVGDYKLQLKIVPIKYLAGFHWLGKDEAVTIELLRENILALLPPVVSHKKH